MITRPGIVDGGIETKEFSDNRANRAKELIRQATDELKPYGGEHIETLMFSFFATRSLLGGNKVELQTFKVLAKDSRGKEFELSSELRQSFLKSAQDRLLELMGAKKMGLKPKSNQQLKDEMSDAGIS